LRSRNPLPFCVSCMCLVHTEMRIVRLMVERWSGYWYFFLQQRGKKIRKKKRKKKRRVIILLLLFSQPSSQPASHCASPLPFFSLAITPLGNFLLILFSFFLFFLICSFFFSFQNDFSSSFKAAMLSRLVRSVPRTFSVKGSFLRTPPTRRFSSFVGPLFLCCNKTTTNKTR